MLSDFRQRSARPFTSSPWNLGLDELRKLREGLLPAEIAHLERNSLRQPFLHYGQLRSTRNFLQGHRRLHFSRQVRVVEAIRIANCFEWDEFTILPAEGVAVACREVRERHLVAATNFGIHVVNLAGETVWRKPLCHCVSV